MEVFVSDASSAAAVSREVKRGTLRKLASRIYTPNLKNPPQLDDPNEADARGISLVLPTPDIVSDGQDTAS
jgi:hypothetical protein